MDKIVVIVFIVIMFILFFLFGGCGSSVMDVKTATRLNAHKCFCSLKCIRVYNARYDVYKVDMIVYEKECAGRMAD